LRAVKEKNPAGPFISQKLVNGSFMDRNGKVAGGTTFSPSQQFFHYSSPIF